MIDALGYSVSVGDRVVHISSRSGNGIRCREATVTLIKNEKFLLDGETDLRCGKLSKRIIRTEPTDAIRII